ncbi:MAG: flagellar hook assembly protein FlgD [Rhizobiales bacterium]|nr:flagellar hook assembly protein FlgD [Hyphomicrobiales bacterium]
MDISALAPAAGQDSKKDSVTRLADNFSDFLKLLTTQLQNQDPTSPMDADQFTQQLVQFSGVEQQIKSNQTLGELATLMQAEKLSQSVSYLGAEVEAEGSVFGLGEDGEATLRYELESPAVSALVRISDELGRTVALRSGDVGAGRHSVTWDGVGDNGVRHTDGSFTFEVIAQSVEGEPVDATTTITGVVDGVEMQGSESLLSIDGILMPLTLISAVRRPALAA